MQSQVEENVLTLKEPGGQDRHCKSIKWAFIKEHEAVPMYWKEQILSLKEPGQDSEDVDLASAFSEGSCLQGPTEKRTNGYIALTQSNTGNGH